MAEEKSALMRTQVSSGNLLLVRNRLGQTMLSQPLSQLKQAERGKVRKSHHLDDAALWLFCAHTCVLSAKLVHQTLIPVQEHPRWKHHLSEKM